MPPPKSGVPPPGSKAAWKLALRQVPANNSRATAAARCREDEKPPASASLHLQSTALGSRHHLGLIHRTDARRADLEYAGVYHLQQIEVLVLAPREIGLEDCQAIVVQFTSCEPVGPPRRAL